MTMSSKTKIIILLCLMTLGVMALLLWPEPSGSRRSADREPSSKPQQAQAAWDRTDAMRAEPVKDIARSPASELVVKAGENEVRRRAAALSRPGPAQAPHTGLYDWLRQPGPDDSIQRGHVFKNEVMDDLCEMKPLPDGLGDLLAEVYRDPAQNVVIRDYAVQHLAEFYTQRARELEGIPAGLQGDLQRARDVLWEAVGETDSSIAGTALLGLRRLSESHQEFDRAQIGATALQLARNGRTGELTRITALQVAASLEGDQILPTAMELARNGESIALRISAVAALGMASNAEAVPLLTELAERGEPRLRPAARHALGRISSN